MRPRGVRWRNPCCTRKGSYTSSIVFASSAIAAPIVLRPTGPPSNFSMIVLRMRASMSSRPKVSTSSRASACSAIDLVMTPFPLTCAKSRTRRSSRFATHDQLEILGRVEVEPLFDPEPRPHRRREHPEPRRGTDERERLDRHRDRLRLGALGESNVDLVVLHRG